MERVICRPTRNLSGTGSRHPKEMHLLTSDFPFSPWAISVTPNFVPQEKKSMPGSVKSALDPSSHAPTAMWITKLASKLGPRELSPQLSRSELIPASYLPIYHRLRP